MVVDEVTQTDAYVEKIVPFAADDGFDLNLINVRTDQAPTRGPVLLVHGAGVRANLFRAPVQTNFVDALLQQGYDVWLENWRASIDFAPNLWTLDQAAVFDHPAAVRKVVEQTGWDQIKAVIHCQGSTSFMMSALAGLVPQVKTIVSNAVSLHTVVPRWSEFKLRFAVPMLKLITPYANPQWGIEAPTLPAKLITGLVRLTHHECRNTVCKLVSFIYGSGCPALWRHENLNDATHQWICGEFGHVPMSFFSQMARCVKRGHLVPVQGYSQLPADFAEHEPDTNARFAFFAGEKSGCFTTESQVRTYKHFCSFGRDDHSLNLVPRYSHLDVFIGKDAARDVYPQMLQELDKD